MLDDVYFPGGHPTTGALVGANGSSATGALVGAKGSAATGALVGANGSAATGALVGANGSAATGEEVGANVGATIGAEELQVEAPSGEVVPDGHARQVGLFTKEVNVLARHFVQVTLLALVAVDP